MITPNLWSKAKNKAAQLAGAPEPRILAVCSTHVGADVLLGTIAAEWFMTSDPMISVGGPTLNVTDLRKASFFRTRDGAIVPANQSISAILLIAISGTRTRRNLACTSSPPNHSRPGLHGAQNLRLSEAACRPFRDSPGHSGRAYVKQRTVGLVSRWYSPVNEKRRAGDGTQARRWLRGSALSC